MFIGSLHRFIPRIFGIEILQSAKLQKATKPDGTIEDIYLQSYWVAEIVDKEFFLNDWPTLCMINTNKWKRGAFLLPSRKNPDQYLLNEEQPMYAVDIPEEVDHVVNILRNIDLFSPTESSHLRGPLFDIRMECSTGYCEAKFVFHPEFSQSESQYKLMRALLNVARYVAKEYNNEEVNRFIRQYPTDDNNPVL